MIGAFRAREPTLGFSERGTFLAQGCAGGQRASAVDSVQSANTGKKKAARTVKAFAAYKRLGFMGWTPVSSSFGVP